MGQVNKRAISLERKQRRYGYIFVMPIILGAILIYIPVFLQSFLFTVSDIVMTPDGFSLHYSGWGNYYKAIMIDPNYRRIVIETVQRMIVEVPIVCIFSFFMANMLNQKFKGRTAARVIFFLPVIIATGIISSVEASDMILSMYRSGGKLDMGGAGGNVFNYMQLRQFLLESNYNRTFINIVLQSIEGLYGIITASGVQMLIFLAGLQSMPNAMYEAAKVEGATAWETFWKISVPVISPLILVNIIYTIIDTFLSYKNEVVNYIRSFSTSANMYEYASTMSWLYFLVIAVLIAIVWIIVKRLVIYQD